MCMGTHLCHHTKPGFNSLNQQTIFHQSQDILTLQLLKITHHTSKGMIGLGQQLLKHEVILNPKMGCCPIGHSNCDRVVTQKVSTPTPGCNFSRFSCHKQQLCSNQFGNHMS